MPPLFRHIAALCVAAAGIAAGPWFLLPTLLGDRALKTDTLLEKAEEPVNPQKRWENLKSGLAWDPMNGRLWIQLGLLGSRKAATGAQPPSTLEMLGWAFYGWPAPPPVLPPMGRAALEESTGYLRRGWETWRAPQIAKTLGMNAFLLEDFENAAKFLRDAMDYNPQVVELPQPFLEQAFARWGGTLWKAGDKVQAQKVWEEGMKFDTPESPELNLMILASGGDGRLTNLGPEYLYLRAETEAAAGATQAAAAYLFQIAETNVTPELLRRTKDIWVQRHPETPWPNAAGGQP